MADFCKICSINIFGEDFGDMAGISTPEQTADERYLVALCEGCGPCFVDHKGICITHDHKIGDTA